MSDVIDIEEARKRARRAAAIKLTDRLRTAWEHLDTVLFEEVTTKEGLVMWEQRVKQAVRRLNAAVDEVFK